MVPPQGEASVLQDQDTDHQIASPGAGPWVELGTGTQQLSGAQVGTYLHTSALRLHPLGSWSVSGAS